MQDRLKPGGGGGAIDMLLIEEDPETGEPMPCTTHDGLSRMCLDEIKGRAANHGRALDSHEVAS